MNTLHNIGRGNMGILSLYAFGFLSLVEWFPMTNPRDSVSSSGSQSKECTCILYMHMRRIE